MDERGRWGGGLGWASLWWTVVWCVVAVAACTEPNPAYLPEGPGSEQPAWINEANYDGLCQSDDDACTADLSLDGACVHYPRRGRYLEGTYTVLALDWDGTAVRSLYRATQAGSVISQDHLISRMGWRLHLEEVTLLAMRGDYACGADDSGRSVLVKLDGAGQVEGSADFVGGSLCHDLEPLDGERVVLAGGRPNDAGYLAMFDAGLELAWFVDTRDVGEEVLSVTSQGGAIYAASDNALTQQRRVYRFNAQGQEQWSALLPSGGPNSAATVVVDQTRVLVLGSDGGQANVTWFSHGGELLGQYNLAPEEHEGAFASVYLTAAVVEDGYWVGGAQLSFEDGSAQGLLHKFNEDMERVSVGEPAAFTSQISQVLPVEDGLLLGGVTQERAFYQFFHDGDACEGFAP